MEIIFLTVSHKSVWSGQSVHNFGLRGCSSELSLDYNIVTTIIVTRSEPRYKTQTLLQLKFQSLDDPYSHTFM